MKIVWKRIDSLISRKCDSRVRGQKFKIMKPLKEIIRFSSSTFDFSPLSHTRVPPNPILLSRSNSVWGRSFVLPFGQSHLMVKTDGTLLDKCFVLPIIVLLVGTTLMLWKTSRQFSRHFHYLGKLQLVTSTYGWNFLYKMYYKSGQCSTFLLKSN